jgi:hypothetical protein
MGAETYELDSTRVPMLSRPKLVLDVIRAAASGSAAARKRATV